jgi:integral membrane protein (TIGR01906 family)
LSRPLVGITRWLVALAMPVFIVLLWVRILWNPWIVEWEYSKPDIPPDPYGFTTQQRIDYALQWVNYYNSNQSPEAGVLLFTSITNPNTGQPLYSPYEVKHMVDVRLVTDACWRILGIASVIVIGGLLALLIPKRTRRDGYAAIFMGGLISTILLAVIIVFVLLSWQTFFITFHEVLFPAGGWTFDYNSALIRIFPDRFWFDVFAYGIGGILVISALVTVVGWLLGRRARRKEAYGTPTENRGTA